MEVYKTNIFTLPDGEYCFGGYGDEVEYSEATGNKCGDNGVASLTLSETKINLGDTLTFYDGDSDANGALDAHVISFTDCANTCQSHEVNLDTSSGAYLNNYGDYRDLLARRLRDAIRTINGGASFEAKIKEEEPHVVLVRSRNLKPVSFNPSFSSSGINSFVTTPRWMYRADSGISDYSCVGENGASGNHIVVEIEDNVTMSHTIKSAIENHAEPKNW